MRRKPLLGQIAAAAYHEAGHAVMCHLVHLRIKSVSIGVDELYGGQTTHENPYRGQKPRIGDTIRERLRLEKIIMLCLAGPLAQRKYVLRDVSHDYGGSIDVDTASTLAIQFFRSRKTADAYMNFARVWVRQKLDDPAIWAAVERLARALLQQRRISGRQAEAIIRGRSPGLGGQAAAMIRRRKTLSPRITASGVEALGDDGAQGPHDQGVGKTS